MSDDYEYYEWRTLEKKYLYRSPRFSFRLDEVALPGGEIIDYGVVETAEIAVILPVTEAGEVVLVRQWRQPVGGFVLSLPGGMVDEEESPNEAAVRELSEETGYRAEEVEHLVSVHSNPGRNTDVHHVFRCRAAKTDDGPSPDPTEFVEVVEVELEAAREELLAGGAADSISLLALTLAELRDRL